MNKWLLIIWIVPLLWSCSDDDNNKGGSSKETKVAMHFSLSVADLQLASGTVATRSIDGTTVQESAIHDLWILQFKGGTLVSDTCINNTGSSTSFNANMVFGPSNIYFVANVGSSAFSTYTVGSTTESAFQSAFKSIGTETDVLENVNGGGKYIPMEGSLTGVQVQFGGNYSLSATLTRMLARVTLKYTTKTSGIEIRKIRVHNVPNSIWYCPPASSTVAFPASPSGTTVNTYDNTDVSGAKDSCTFYIPENQRGSGSNPTADVTRKTGVPYATYFELVGYTKGAGPNTAGQEVVYRLYPGADNYNDYNICRNTSYTLTANIAGASMNDSRVTRPSRANCYIVTPGNSVYIPLTRANDSDLGTQIADVTASGYTFGVVWQDQSSSTSSVVCSQSDADRSFGVFKVTTASGYTGNAVVYVMSGTTILWSWHIWVTNYDPQVSNSTIGSYTFMNCNLGTTNITPGQAYKGLYYQWGRKDPFPQASAVNVSTMESIYSGMNSVSMTAAQVTDASNLANSIHNPMVFYFPGDWFSNTTHNDGLWSTVKTVYDPCPVGWKVAPVDAYSSFSGSIMTYNGVSYGWSYNMGNLFFPLSGCLHSGNGGIDYLGSSCYIWAASVSSNLAYSCFLDQNNISTSSNYRALGAAVRCVKE